MDLGLRQPRRAGPGQRPLQPAHQADRDRRQKIINLPPGTNVGELAGQLVNNDPQGLADAVRRPVARRDPRRQPATAVAPETIAEYFTTAGAPHGHGYTAWNLATGNAYYAFGKGQVRHIVLDTVNPYGGSEGSIDQTQLDWLTGQLKGQPSLPRRVRPRRQGRQARQAVRHLLPPHHRHDGQRHRPGRVLGPAVRNLLLRFPNVVLWVNGHTHRNTVTPYSRGPRRAKAPGGFWEVNTAAHVDWPQQARTVEIVDNRNGTLSVFGTIIDHAAPTSYGKHPKSAARARRALPRAGRQRLAGERQVAGGRGRAPRAARGPQRRAAPPGALQLSHDERPPGDFSPGRNLARRSVLLTG